MKQSPCILRSGKLYTLNSVRTEHTNWSQLGVYTLYLTWKAHCTHRTHYKVYTLAGTWSTLYLTWKAFYLSAAALHCHDKHCIWHWTRPLHDTPVYCVVCHPVPHHITLALAWHTSLLCCVAHLLDTPLYCAACHTVHSTLHKVQTETWSPLK